jgi:asparagine synthase (glutamine-hydrolysing)
MCSIAGVLNLSFKPIERIEHSLHVMNTLQKHRGPDGEGIWCHPNHHVGLAHRRLSIIDLSDIASQPMTDHQGNWIVYNGEIYNYVELREEIGNDTFFSHSDTEVILRAYQKWGTKCVEHLRGMFAFAIWDEKEKKLFCARDRFGIKPFYYAIVDGLFIFASEIKAILPFLTDITTDIEGFKEYLTFQFCLAGKTLFSGVKELLPAHNIVITPESCTVTRYWEVYYIPDFDHTEKYFQEKVHELLLDSVKMHLRSDVPVGAYVSGGIDSSTIASIASQFQEKGAMIGFTGKFSAYGSEYDESHYARSIANKKGFPLHEIDINGTDFIENIRKVIYHLDFPVAGPGSFPQYMVSQLAARYRKVVLGGQGGDEIFGGYTRYLIAYFEQCIKGAIEGTMDSGNFIVTYESIIPNLVALQNYKPLLQEFWREGLFGEMDLRYFRLINRAPSLDTEINWSLLEEYSAKETFRSLFNSDNVRHASYFDLMTHFDFKTLLPALLQVEDRMSMAHGLESRVPFLDYRLVELAATIPSNIKFKDGTMKQLLKQVTKEYLTEEIFNRKDKMGFPTPLNEWISGEARDFVRSIFSSVTAKNRDLIDNTKVLEKLDSETKYGRKIWGLLCLELWQQEFHDKKVQYKKLLYT